ncbi:MAG TPA: sialidase family protein [Xanthomonadaceae bacterium]|nr:sialidase family protein [Xanthomonadaceae bacterium]
MRALLPIGLLVLATTVAGCDATSPEAGAPQAEASGAAAAAATAETPLHVATWTLPAPDGAAQPDLVAAPDGTLLLSWIEPRGDGHVLRFARHDGGSWSTPRTIAAGDDWFVNWADTPHLAATADGALWAHWLRKSAAATYAYDVVLTRSGDGGDTWSEPLAVNQDGTPTEHGFVAMWPAGASSLGIAWLDGRATAGGGHGGHGAGGMMTLRTARFDASLARHDETRLDASACDCCQTSAAMTADGPVVAYRDRTHAEIRDIAVIRQVAGQWQDPRIVHADGWKMPACPVNGPGLDARGDDVVVAWYTGAGGTPHVRVAASNDRGASFGAPVDVDAGENVQGRLAVALGDGGAWVAWLREDAGGQALRLVRFDPATGSLGRATRVSRVAGKGRGTGFPQLALAGDRAHVVWTDVVDGKPRLRGAIVSAD